MLETPEVVARPERDEPDRLAVLVGDEAGRVLPAPGELRQCGPTFRLGRAGSAAADAERALLCGAVSREEIPTGRAPRAARHGLHVVDARRGEGPDRQLAVASCRHF